MRTRLTSLLTLLAALFVLLPAAGPAIATSERTVTTVDGAVAHPLMRLTMDDLRAFPQRRERVGFLAGGERERHAYRGPLLFDVLAAAEPTFDPGVKNDQLRHAVLVTAMDEYQAVVAWGEIDPGFAGNEVLLAVEEDRHPLKRPRLVVPGDERGGRYVSDVTTVSLLRVGG